MIFSWRDGSGKGGAPAGGGGANLFGARRAADAVVQQVQRRLHAFDVGAREAAGRKGLLDHPATVEQHEGGVQGRRGGGLLRMAARPLRGRRHRDGVLWGRRCAQDRGGVAGRARGPWAGRAAEVGPRPRSLRLLQGRGTQRPDGCPQQFKLHSDREPVGSGCCGSARRAAGWRRLSHILPLHPPPSSLTPLQ